MFPRDGFRRASRPARVAALATVAIGGLVLGAVPATAATPNTAAAPHGLCIPATWYQVTNVITRAGIVQLLPTAVEPNESSTPSTISMTVEVNGSLTAGVSGDIPVAPANIAASIGPEVSATIGGSVSITGTVTVPPGQTGFLRFGIITEQTNGIAFFRDFFCNVTSEPEIATAPEGFGYIASTAPTHPTGATDPDRRAVVVTTKA
jgi:hypothetical protein